MTFFTEHTARKRYVCDWECGEPIEPGTRYVRAAAPPWSEGNEDDHWNNWTLHGRFPDECPEIGRNRREYLWQLEAMYS